MMALCVAWAGHDRGGYRASSHICARWRRKNAGLETSASPTHPRAVVLLGERAATAELGAGISLRVAPCTYDSTSPRQSTHHISGTVLEHVSFSAPWPTPMGTVARRRGRRDLLLNERSTESGSSVEFCAVTTLATASKTHREDLRAIIFCLLSM